MNAQETSSANGCPNFELLNVDLHIGQMNYVLYVKYVQIHSLEVDFHSRKHSRSLFNISLFDPTLISFLMPKASIY